MIFDSASRDFAEQWERERRFFDEQIGEISALWPSLMRRLGQSDEDNWLIVRSDT